MKRHLAWDPYKRSSPRLWYHNLCILFPCNYKLYPFFHQCWLRRQKKTDRMDRCYFNLVRPELLSEPNGELDKLKQIWPLFLTLSISYVLGFLGYHWLVFGLWLWLFLNQYNHSVQEQERHYFRYWRTKKLAARFWVTISLCFLAHLFSGERNTPLVEFVPLPLVASHEHFLGQINTKLSQVVIGPDPCSQQGLWSGMNTAIVLFIIRNTWKWKQSLLELLPSFSIKLKLSNLPMPLYVIVPQPFFTLLLLRPS